MIRRFFLITIFFLASSGRASGPEDIDLVKKMPNVVKEVIAKSFVLPKDTFGFHWQRQGAILWDNKMPKDSSDYQVQEYIRERTSRFWEGANSGEGLYFAMDPSSTSYIGETLIKVTFRKGTRYFTINNYNNSFDFSSEAQSELESRGCSALSLQGVYFNLGCIKIARALTRELKISFYVYDYLGILPETCTKNSTVQAFVLFDPTAIVLEKTFIFPGDGKIDTPYSSRKRELGMLAHFHIRDSLTNSYISNFFANHSASDAEFNAWVHEGFYGCDYDPFTIHELK